MLIFVFLLIEFIQLEVEYMVLIFSILYLLLLNIFIF